MKLLSLAIAALPLALVLPRGGTLLEFTVDGRTDSDRLEAAKARLKLETWDCAQHPINERGKIQLPVCSRCSQSMSRPADAAAKVKPAGVKPDVFVEVSEQRLRIMSGPSSGIGMLRKSVIDAALTDTGLTLRAGWKLSGHVLLEIETTAKARREELEKTLAPFGKAEVDANGTLVLVRFGARKQGYEHAQLIAAAQAAGYPVKDTLWIINDCSGELVLPR